MMRNPAFWQTLTSLVIFQGEPINKVAEKFGVSRSTLQKKVKAARDLSPQSLAASPTPTKEEVVDKNPSELPSVVGELKDALREALEEITNLKRRVQTLEAPREEIFHEVFVEIQYVKGFFRDYDARIYKDDGQSYWTPTVRVLGLKKPSPKLRSFHFLEGISRGTPVWVTLGERWSSAGRNTWTVTEVTTQEPNDRVYQGIELRMNSKEPNLNHGFVFATFVV